MTGERQADLSPTARLQAELFAPVTAEAAGSKATLRIFGRIDPDGAPWGVSAADVQAALDSLPDDVTDLEVQVQTRGGDAFEGIAIMNMLRNAPQRTETLVVGLAASAGAFIAQGSDKVTMMPHSQMMIHRGSVLAIGQAPDMRMLADRLDSLDKTQAGVYATKAGGTEDEWLAALTPETWYTADEAVSVGLADGIRANAKKPDGAKATAELDLSVFAYAGREAAPAPFVPQTSATTPQEPSTDPKEADAMSDTLITGLRERFGFAEDAEESAIFAAIDGARDPDTSDEAIAKARGLSADTVKAALDGAKAGKITVSEPLLDQLRADAALGREARVRQLTDERDGVIQAAVTEGKISRERTERWAKAWDADPEGTKAELDGLEARFPVAKPAGYLGDPSGDPSAVFTDAEAEALAALTGTRKEGLLT